MSTTAKTDTLAEFTIPEISGEIARRNGHGKPHAPRVILENIPAELKKRRQFVMWRFVWIVNKKGVGKWDKPPLKINGKFASTSAPATWATYDQAVAALPTFDGIGLVFGVDLAGIDFDNCFDDAGNLSAWARELLDLCPVTYTELSPSGRGLHLIYVGTLPDILKGREFNHAPHTGIATYCNPSNKYFTLTGSTYPIGGAPVAVAVVTPDHFAALRDRLCPHEQKTAAKSIKPAAVITLDDQAVVTRAQNAGNGAKFDQLWKGSSVGYKSASEADQALVNMLAFWTRDHAQIERLWLSSGLRDADDPKIQRADYRARTIAKALADVTPYDPNYHAPAAAIGDDVPEQPGDDPTFANLQSTPAAKPAKDRKPATKSAAYIAALSDLGYSFRLNQLTQEIEVNGVILSDHIQAEIRVKMRDLTYTSTKAFEDAYIAHALQNAYHPIKNYLNGLQWDGLGHIEQLGTFLVSNHAPFANGDAVPARFLRRWLIGAVGKVFDRVQTPMLVLEGRQNLGKSQFVAWLASVLPDYFIEGPIAPDDKDSKIRLMSRWLWEVSELGATTRRSDVEALKSFVTLRDVTVRKPYGHHDVHGPAVCSLIGTLNDSGGFLNDTTGSRRFLTLALSDLNWDYRSFVNIDQVWAQAVSLYRAGESPYLTPEERSKQEAINETFTAVDPVEDVITSRFVIDPTRQDWRTPSADVLRAVDDTLHGTSIGHARAIAACLKSRGIVASRPYIGGRQVRGYCGLRPMTEVESNQMQDATRRQDG